jgi:hypothetical protein
MAERHYREALDISTQLGLQQEMQASVDALTLLASARRR